MALRTRTKKRNRAPLASHPAFAPIVALWLCSLLGLAPLVTGFGLRFALAGGALGAAAGWVLARLAARRAYADKGQGTSEPDFDTKLPDSPVAEDRGSSRGMRWWATRLLAAFHGKDIAQEEKAPETLYLTYKELGSESLDSPLEAHEARDETGIDEAEEYLADEPLVEAISDEEIAEEAAFEEPVADGLPVDSSPREIEEVLPQGDTAPVEETDPAPAAGHEPTPEPEAVEAACEPDDEPRMVAPGLARLRERDPADMSLVELIERFAGALAERREDAERDPEFRDRAQPIITEALRALTAHGAAGQMVHVHGNAALALSTREQADVTEAALRNALEKLQQMSGG